MTLALLFFAGALSGIGEVGFLPWRLAAARSWVRFILGWRIAGVFDGQHTYRWLAVFILMGLMFADGAAWATEEAGPLYLWLWPWAIHITWFWQIRNIFFHSGLVMRKIDIEKPLMWEEGKETGYDGRSWNELYLDATIKYVRYPDWSAGQRVMLLITTIAEVVLQVS